MASREQTTVGSALETIRAMAVFGRVAKASRSLVLSLAAVCLAVLMVVPANATFPGPNGKIAFERGGNIWVMSPNGTGLVRLTSSGTAANPQWSADGKKIAYDQRSSTTGLDLWVMNANGANKYRVTKHLRSESDPAWSPNGAWLAFTTDRNGRREIFKIRSIAPFGTAIQLTRTAGTGEPEPTDEDPIISDSQPNWSPSGSRISFSRFITSDPTSSSSWGRELMTMAPDGSAVFTSPLNGTGETCTSWGPGGRRIAWVDTEFDFEHGLASSNVWHTNPDGSEPVKVTAFGFESPWQLGCGSWSPDRGTTIVFSGFVDTGDPTARPAIYRVPANGASSPVLIASNGVNPDWGRIAV